MGGPGDSGRHPDDWWLNSDGNWYPPSLAHHPAARDDPGARRAAAVADLLPVSPATARRSARRVVLSWAALLVPLLVVAGLLVAMLGLAAGERIGRTETAGGGERPRPTSATRRGQPSTTVPVTAAPASPTSVGTGALPGSPTDPVPGRSPLPAGPPATGSSTPGSPGAVPPGPAPRTRPVPPPSPTSPVVDPPAPPPAGDPPPGPVPTSVEQCQHGGWAHVVDDLGRPFANQGQCVAFVQRSRAEPRFGGDEPPRTGR